MKVKLRKNLRNFDAEGTDFIISGTEEKEIPTRELRSYDIKYSLMKGNLIPTEGELIINIKAAKILFSAENHPMCYGMEYGKFFEKNLDTQQLFWKAEDEINSEIISKLKGEEPKVEESGFELTDEESEENKIEEPEVEDEAEVEEEYYKELVAIHGVGKKTAVDIMTVYPTKEKLIEAVDNKENLPWDEDIDEKLIEKFSSFSSDL